MSVTLKQALDQLTTRHSQYIESTYHIKNSRLIKERKDVLATPSKRRSDLSPEGLVATEPWIEATPAYESGKPFLDLAIPDVVKQLLDEFQRGKLGAFPPYKHQEVALEGFFGNNQDLVVSTGTGSGKTEIFLYSILGQLAREGGRGTSQARSLRAIVLYPMNALVSDQLSRLRRMFGNEEAAGLVKKRFGRIAQFGMYTSRTPYHGEYDPKKNDSNVKPLVRYFAKLAVDPQRKELFQELQKRGRIPAKDLGAFYGERQDPLTRYRTQPGDRELFTRQEMHSPNKYGGTPDVLVTNYSMLQYMLLRPIEQPLFDDTSKWLASHKENQLLIVIDEAHLYRGAQGAEISMLLRRLMQRLGVDRSKVRFILTSASLGGKSAEETRTLGQQFAAKLTGGIESQFLTVTGARRSFNAKGTLPPDLADALSELSADITPSEVQKVFSHFKWGKAPEKKEDWQLALGKLLTQTSEYKIVHDALVNGPREVPTLAAKLFPGVPHEKAKGALLNFALLAAAAKTADEQPLLPMRLHLMLKGLPRQFACVNPTCPGRHYTEQGPFGKVFFSAQLKCNACDSRVFEVYTHRTCGASYLRAFTRSEKGPKFLWGEDVEAELQEIHLLAEPPRSDPDLKHKTGQSLAFQNPPSYLDIRTGYLFDVEPEGPQCIMVWRPAEGAVTPGTKKKPVSKPAEPQPLSWKRCPACGIDESRRKSGQVIMDLETKGEDPFGNIVRTLFDVQPPAVHLAGIDNAKLPNKGKKVLCFSDSRQKAARLARDLQRTVERDSFRELLVMAASRAGEGAPLEQLFTQLVLITKQRHISLFDDEDEELPDRLGSRSQFLRAQLAVKDVLRDFLLASEEDIAKEETARMQLENFKPPQYNEQLLRALGDSHFSVRQTLVGFVQPTPAAWTSLTEMNPKIPSDLLRPAILASIENALSDRAVDGRIGDPSRRRSRATPTTQFGFPRDGGEGLDQNDILPEDVATALKSHGLTDDDLQSLRASMRRGTAANALFTPERARLWLNPKAVTLQVAAFADWYVCKGCGRMSPFAFRNKCVAIEECGGTMEPLPADDLYLSTRRAFLREPVQELVAGTRQPFTLRSEEHTAQLTAKDKTEVFGKAEKYELLFQDVLVDDLEGQQPVDVLSCTTTMEVGIDIGSLTAVALRTVPPRPDNYQQRAGRAGRRGSALSIIVTFADNSPHESFVFQNPATMIGALSSPPSIYVDNPRIAERHVHASLIQAFFQRKIPEAQQLRQSNQSIFESLGSASDFFGTAGGPYSLNAFEGWVEKEGAHLQQVLGKFLPEGVAEVATGKTVDARQVFVQSVINNFVAALRGLSTGHAWDSPENAEENLLSVLMDEALLPTFGFPIDLCTFAVRDWDRGKGRVVNRYEMQQDLATALSEYVPGRELVVDKRTYVSYGLYFPYTTDEANRARIQDWDALEWLNHCRRCNAIFDETEKNLAVEQEPCPSCHEIVSSLPRFKPRGFSPRFGIDAPIEGGSKYADRLPASYAEFPVPVVPMPKPGTQVQKVSEVATWHRLPAQRLVVANFGPEKEGFYVCRDCGAVGIGAAPPTPHSRPYPVPLRKGLSAPKMCKGDAVVTSFAFEFTTDLAIFRISVKGNFDFAPATPWFRAAALSLSEAFVLGATRALGIDASELAGNYRAVARYVDDEPDVIGNLEFFLYDTTPGGAGFAAKAAAHSTEVLRETQAILSGCTCGSSCVRCLRTYDNRLHHNILSRHYAISLLGYGLTGKFVDLDAGLSKYLRDLLVASLRLRVPDVSATLQPNDRVQVSKAGKQVTISVRPALSAMVRTLGNDGGAAHPVTDYDLERRIPHVVSQVSSKL